MTFMNGKTQLGSSPSACVCVVHDMSLFNREHGCVCWWCWNSIRQMGLFRVLSLLPKKGPICSSLLPTIHINMYSTFPFCLHFSIHLPWFFVLPFAFCFRSLQLLMKTKSTWTLSQPENELEKHNSGVLQVSRERRKREPLVRSFYCRDYSVRLDSKSESWSRQPGPRWRKKRTEMIHLYCGSLRAG